jgi:hypothetical protein
MIVGGTTDGRSKIASFNVNGIAARLPNPLRWLAENQAGLRMLSGIEAPT